MEFQFIITDRSFVRNLLCSVKFTESRQTSRRHKQSDHPRKAAYKEITQQKL